MPRKKLKLAFIGNATSRRATNQKRASTLVNKVNEISTLCGVDACVVIYNPHELESEPLVWPDTAETKNVLAKFKMIPEMERCQNMVDQKKYNEKELEKAKKQLEKLKEDNKNKMAQVMYQWSVTGKIPHLSLEHLNSLKEIVDENLTENLNGVESLKNETTSLVPYHPPAPLQKGHNGI